MGVTADDLAESIADYLDGVLDESLGEGGAKTGAGSQGELVHVTVWEFHEDDSETEHHFEVSIRAVQK